MRLPRRLLIRVATPSFWLHIPGLFAGMIGASILVSLLTALVTLTSLANQLVLARMFGASGSMDAYLLAISAPMLVSGVLAAVMNYSLVPVLVTYRSDRAAYARFCVTLLAGLAAISLVFAVLGYVLSPVQISVLGGPLSEVSKVQALAMARIAWFVVVFGLLVGQFNAMHNVEKSFVLPVIASALPFGGMITSAILFGGALGPIAVVRGMLGGYALAVLLLYVTLPWPLEWSLRNDSMWRPVAEYLGRAPLVILGMLCFTVYQTIDAYWAPRIGTGNLAYLGYAQRLLIAVGNLVIAGPSAVLLPRFAEAYAAGRTDDMLRDAGRAVRAVIAFAAPVGLWISILAQPLIRVLFQRGAFGALATTHVAHILPLMMCGMVAMLAVVIMFRVLFAKRALSTASLLGAFATVLYFTLSGAFSRFYGVSGIALAYAVSWWSVFTLAALSLWRSNVNVGISASTQLLFAAKVLGATAGSGIVVYLGHDWASILAGQLGTTLLRLFVVGGVGGVVYLVLALWVFRISEVCEIMNFLRSRFFFSRSAAG